MPTCICMHTCELTHADSCYSCYMLHTTMWVMSYHACRLYAITRVKHIDFSTNGTHMSTYQCRNITVGNCTEQMTSCQACYFAGDERPLPSQCSTSLKKYKCAGLAGNKKLNCLKKWGNCVKKDCGLPIGDVYACSNRKLTVDWQIAANLKCFL